MIFTQVLSEPEVRMHQLYLFFPALSTPLIRILQLLPLKNFN